MHLKTNEPFLEALKYNWTIALKIIFTNNDTFIIGTKSQNPFRGALKIHLDDSSDNLFSVLLRSCQNGDLQLLQFNFGQK